MQARGDDAKISGIKIEKMTPKMFTQEEKMDKTAISANNSFGFHPEGGNNQVTNK